MDFGTYKSAGFFMGVSAVLHGFAFLVAGFTPDAMIFACVGVVYGFLAWGLFLSQRGLAYIVFLVALIGISLAISLMGSSAIPSWWLLLIIFADFMVALNLFLRLWSKAGYRR